MFEDLKNLDQKLKDADFRALSNMLKRQIDLLEKNCKENSFNDKPVLLLSEVKEYQQELRERLRVMILCLQNSMRLVNIENLDIFQYRNWKRILKLIFRAETHFPFSISPEIKTQVVEEFWKTSALDIQEKVRKIFAVSQRCEQEIHSRQTFRISLVKPVHRIQDSQL